MKLVFGWNCCMTNVSVIQIRTLILLLLIVMLCIWAMKKMTLSKKEPGMFSTVWVLFTCQRVHVLVSWCPAGRAAWPGSGENRTVMKKHWMRSRCVVSYHRRQCWLGSLSSRKMLKQCWLVLFAPNLFLFLLYSVIRLRLFYCAPLFVIEE